MPVHSLHELAIVMNEFLILLFADQILYLFQYQYKTQPQDTSTL